MEKLASYMHENSLRQDQMANLVGCKQSTISKLLREVISPSLEMAVAIEDATGGKVRPRDWVNLETHPPQGEGA